MSKKSVMALATGLVCLFAMVKSGCSYAIDQPTSLETNESEAAALQAITNFRSRLSAEGLLKQSLTEASAVNNFDELEVLQMLPFIIRQMKKDSLTPTERDGFELLYGSIWDLLVEESHRHRGQPRNAILAALMASPEIRQGQQNIRDELGNDVEHNSVSKVYKGSSSTKAIVFDEKDLPQRVLRMAAAIVQKYYQRRAKAAPSSRRKAVQARRHQQRSRKMPVHAKQLSADSIRVTIELPRFKRTVPVKQQPLASLVAGQDELDEEMEAKIMAAIQAQIGNPSLEDDNDDDDDDDDNGEDEGEAVIHEDDSSEYLDDEADYMGVLGDEDDDEDDDDDDDDDIDTDLLQVHAHNFENPSFNELLLLAARHRATQQQHKMQQQHRAIKKLSSNMQSSYEDY